tara:strand:- start:801 stop:1775 length:975 start_codon:yes stop_codon:yes gene_type:complete
MDLNNITIKKCLFVFSDPGGAKPILSIIKNNKFKNYIVYSDRNYNFYKDFDIEVNIINISDVENICTEIKPDIIFTGTSYTSELEVQFIKTAKNNSIRTFSYIDHYTNLKSRFKLNDSFYFPDEIFLIDTNALEIGLKEGLNNYSRLQLLENPYHYFLKRWEPKIDRKNLIENFNIKKDVKILVFGPDPLSNVNHISDYGYDEIDVWKDLEYAITKSNLIEFVIIVKLHPNQNKEYLNQALIKSKILKNIYIYDDSNSIDLLFHADIIIGMFSSLLIEANIINIKSKVIRHLPKKNISDPIKHLNIGLISQNRSELKSNLNLIL